MASEKNFENRVKKFLKDEACYFIKYWGGGEYTKSGVPDILVCCNGRFLGVEIKAPTGRPKLLQIHHLKQINDAGGFGILLYPEHFTLFQNLVFCIKANDPNMYYNHDIFNQTLLKWERRLNKDG